MARYSLIAENNKTKDRYLIRMKERNNNGFDVFKEKVNLSTIDKFTLDYKSSDELANALYQTGIIPNSDVKFYIEYISKKTPVQIPLAYKELASLRYFTLNAPIKVSFIDPKYTSVVNNFLNNCIDKDFLQYQIDNGFLHEYNADYVREYVRLAIKRECPRSIDRQRSLIYTLFNRYKRIRGIIVGSREYYQSIINNTEDVEIVDDCEDLDSIYFGSGYPGDRLTSQKRINYKS